MGQQVFFFFNVDICRSIDDFVNRVETMVLTNVLLCCQVVCLIPKVGSTADSNMVRPKRRNGHQKWDGSMIITEHQICHQTINSPSADYCIYLKQKMTFTHGAHICSLCFFNVCPVSTSILSWSRDHDGKVVTSLKGKIFIFCYLKSEKTPIYIVTKSQTLDDPVKTVT